MWCRQKVDNNKKTSGMRLNEENNDMMGGKQWGKMKTIVRSSSVSGKSLSL